MNEKVEVEKRVIYRPILVARKKQKNEKICI